MVELNFSIVLKEKPVTLTGKEGLKKYTLRELTSSQRQMYNDFHKIKMEMTDGKPKLSSADGFKIFPVARFVALCLYDENNKPVSENVINDFPGQVTNSLHKAGLTLSGMDKEAEGTAKNE